MYYLVKDIDGNGVSIAVIQAESDEALIPKLIQLGVNSTADIHHVETLPFDKQGVCMVYEQEHEVNDD